MSYSPSAIRDPETGERVEGIARVNEGRAWVRVIDNRATVNLYCARSRTTVSVALDRTEAQVFAHCVREAAAARRARDWHWSRAEGVQPRSRAMVDIRYRGRDVHIRVYDGRHQVILMLDPADPDELEYFAGLIDTASNSCTDSRRFVFGTGASNPSDDRAGC